PRRRGRFARARTRALDARRADRCLGFAGRARWPDRGATEAGPRSRPSPGTPPRRRTRPPSAPPASERGRPLLQPPATREDLAFERKNVQCTDEHRAAWPMTVQTFRRLGKRAGAFGTKTAAAAVALGHVVVASTSRACTESRARRTLRGDREANRAASRA